MEKMILEARGVTRTYSNGLIDVPALKECDISIKKGEFVAVVGKSGSGKSTLLHILAGLDEPDAGEVWISGKNIVGMREKEKAVFRRRSLGYVYQDYNLMPEFTSYENIALPLRIDGRRESREEILGLLETLGIEECEKKFSQEMSGGEQQRVSIARALVTKPEVIFADEPSGNLDGENAKNVAELLAKASEQYHQTIVMVTHDQQMADYADRILRIADGVVG
ncbi:ABC transporter ATP-binding protein [bacterium D16-51]|nr:ABC transporter ATP-binding protein [bacterium D16-59]RKI61130.1 ABC transporter ATP-binding protein [bacterium D16-51]